jgi:hypothetical protein
VKKDLASGDPDKVLTALVVGLMDHTAERVGNDESAEERGHFGVTGWQKSHVSFSKGKATVKYVGKSGVKQKKVVSEKALVRALKDAHAACEDDDIFCHDGGKITAAKVNVYLKTFDVTAKDLRGLHANSRMQDALKAARKAGGELPTDPKKRKAQLKKEWKKALEETASNVGHEPNTLNSQYLVPGLEEEFMKGGKVMDKMVKTAERGATVPRRGRRVTQRLVRRYLIAGAAKRAAYTEDTLAHVMAGMGMLLAQGAIVSNQFFDEPEIRKYLALRRQYHDTFAEACEDLAEAIIAGSFGEAAKASVGALQQVGAIPAKDAQRALRLAAKALRALKAVARDLEGDRRLVRVVFLAHKLAAARGEQVRTDEQIEFLKELLKVQAIPAPVRTLFRKAIKYRPSYENMSDTANAGAWFDMDPKRKDNIRSALADTIKERDEVYDKIQDPEKRQQEYQRLQRRVERIRNVAGVNVHIIQKTDQDDDGPSLEAALKKESKLQVDGPTEYIQQAIEKYFRNSYAKDGKLPREHGKLLTQIKKARTLDTVRRVLSAAKAKRLIFDDTVEQLETLWAMVGKNLAVKKGVKLTPLQWAPIDAEEFQKKHSTGKITFDEAMSEDERRETLGRVSRAVDDLEGIFGKGFCGKHAKPLEFSFEGATGFAQASYFAYGNRDGSWQPRVKFGEDYAGVLAHELSHYFDDLLANKIEKIVNPEHYAKFPHTSRELFGGTGVSLENAQKHRNKAIGQVIPELAEFVDVVLATPDYARWKDMTSSAHERGIDKAIEQLTGVRVYDLPREHPYAKIHRDMPRYRSEWPPELLEATEKSYANLMDGDVRKLTYHHSAIEIWARMVEQYVATRLADAGIANPWLNQLSYDLDELPQMMEQSTFEKKIAPLLDKVFATIKDKSLIASRVAERYRGGVAA